VPHLGAEGLASAYLLSYVATCLVLWPVVRQWLRGRAHAEVTTSTVETM
jgi:hypothetical protein